MSEVIDFSKYGRDNESQKVRWDVTYEGNGRGDGMRITAVFEPEHLDAVVASIRKQMQEWANEPKPSNL